MLGIAHLGALSCLQTAGLFDLSELHWIIGSSVGGLIGLLLVCGYHPHELFEIVKGVDLFDLGMNHLDLSLVLSDFGVCDGTRIVNKIRELLVLKNIPINITFDELYRLKKIRLTVTTLCVNEMKTKLFDYVHTPRFRVVDAVRASISIPFCFTSPVFKNQRYCDGGVLDNFPVHYLPESIPHTNIIGLRFKKAHSTTPRSLETFEDFTIQLINGVMQEITSLKLQQFKTHRSQTTIIDIPIDDTIDLLDLLDCFDDESKVDMQDKLWLLGQDAIDDYLTSDRFVVRSFECFDTKTKKHIVEWMNS